MKNPSSKINWRKTTLSLLITLICGVVGFFIAWELLEKVADGSFAWWQSLGTPPELPRKIAGLDTYWQDKSADVYIETIAGSIYLHRKDVEKWEMVSLPPDLYKFPCDEHDVGRQPYFVNLPARVVDCQRIPWSSEWITDTTYFVILEDNSVWQWRNRMGFDTLFAFLCGGPIIGLVIGWSLAKITWRRYQKMLHSLAT
jgi:hypothetical protein